MTMYNEFMIQILYGTDDSRLTQKKAQLRDKYKDADKIDIDCVKDGADALFAAIDSVDLFSSQKLIFADNASFLSSKNTTDIDPNEVLKRQDTEHILVLIVHAEKLDQRKKAVKQLSKTAALVPCKSLDARSQSQYLSETLERYGVRVDRDSFNWLTSHIGMDPLRIEKEVEKLSIFDPHPGFEDVKKLVTIEPVDNVFVMTDALFEKNGLRLLAAYRNFRDQSMEPLAIVMLLAGQVRFLFQVRILMDDGVSSDEAARILQVHPYRAKRAMENASRFSAEELMDILEQLAGLEQSMKTDTMDKDAGFEMFCIKLVEEN